MNQRPIASIILSLALLASFQADAAQETLVGKVSNFKVVPGYFDPPHETQMKSQLVGAEAQPQAGGKVVVKEARLLTFKETGEREMQIEAPECIYDQGLRTVSSPGPLRVQTADGKFRIEGVGFRWQQTNTSLLISNRVHTWVHPDVLKERSASLAPANMPTMDEGIEITSDTFEFTQSRLGTYRGNMNVKGPKLAISGDRLEIEVPLAERQLQTVTAKENVVIDYADLHGKGGKAVYSTTTGLMELTEDPTWRAGEREGGGDHITMDATNRVFRVDGKAHMKLPSGALGTSGLLGAVETNALAASPSSLEVSCGNYEIRTNQAVFSDAVRAINRAGEEDRGKLSCGMLYLAFMGTNNLQSMTAEKDVSIEQADRGFKASKAVFTASTAELELTGDPSWYAGDRSGKGDVIRVNRQRDEMLVLQNAYLRLPAQQLGQAFSRKTDADKPASPSELAGFAEVFSQEYILTLTNASFSGVRIEHPQVRWASETMQIDFPPGGGRADRLLAQNDVTFQFSDEGGQTVRGTGDKAVYRSFLLDGKTNETLYLTGRPARLQTTNTMGENSIFVVDLLTGKVGVPGRYRLKGDAPPGAEKFELPKTRFLK